MVIVINFSCNVLPIQYLVSLFDFIYGVFFFTGGLNASDFVAELMEKDGSRGKVWKRRGGRRAHKKERWGKGQAP